MPRYTKQRNLITCGPIAILNSLRWARIDSPYRHFYPALAELCDCGIERKEVSGCVEVVRRGTFQHNFDRALRQATYGVFRVRRSLRPSLADLEHHLKNVGPIVLNYKWRRYGEESRHYTLLAGTNPEGTVFYTVNNSRQGRALQAEQRKDFVKRALQFRNRRSHYKAWFLTPA